jgi:hypothetical protein
MIDMNNIWKEMGTAYFRALFRNLPQETKKNTNSSEY